MKIEIELATRDKCTGCAACVDSCTRNCITMELSNSIHTYPLINSETCISCGKCVKSCPAINTQESINRPQKYYMAWHKNDEERITSTSGGVGVVLVEKSIEKGWHVCGAAMDYRFELRHIITNDYDESKLLKGSKYLQSDTKGVFKQIKDLALRGESVLFIGTPCQVESINRILPEGAKENVLTCGIICHGVNSPKVWKDYKSWLEERYGSTLKEYHFRSKSHGWQKKNGGANLRVSFSFRNGKSIDQPAWMNQFHWWFGHHFILRPSCLDCDYRREYRNSDLTIGDFWGVDKISKDVNTFKGVSVIIASSAKGDEFIHECNNMQLEEVDGEKSKNVLRGFVESQTLDQRLKQIEREKLFEKEYLESGFETMVNKYPHQTYFSRAINIIKTKLGLKA